MAAEVLTETDSVALWHEYVRTRDVTMRNDLVLQHLGLVYRLANQHAPLASDSVQDLIQEGCLGLIRAVERFRPDYGVQFSTYAYPVISGAIKNYLRYRRRLLGKQTAYRLDDESRPDSENSGLLPPTGEELVAPGDIEAFAQAVDQDFPDQVIARLVTDDLLSRLPAIEQRIVTHFFYDDLTQREIGRLVARSNSRVCRLLRRALERLRLVLVRIQREERHVTAATGPPLLQAAFVVDVETGLFGPAHLRRSLGRELARARALGAPLSLAMLRPRGPQGEVTPRLLVETARHIYRRVRVLDHVFRAGPHELALVFSLPAREAASICGRLGADEASVTVDYAIRSFPEDGDSLSGLLAAARAGLG